MPELPPPLSPEAQRATLRPARADREPGAGLLAAMTAELDELYAGRAGSLDSIPAKPDQMAPPAGSFLLVELDGKAVGCGGVKRLAPGLAEIKRMYLAPAVRGLGLSRLLLAGLEAECRRLGYGGVRLDTGPEQPHARALYESSGYSAIADYNGNPYAAHWFEKRLSAAGPED